MRRGCWPRGSRARALGLDAEVAAVLDKRHLDRPAADKQAQHVQRIGGLVRAEESLRLELAGRVADEHLSDRHLLAVVIPERRAGDDVELAFALPILARDREALPLCFGVGQALELCQLARAGHARASLGAGQVWRGRFEQAGVEPQPGDYGHMPEHGGEQLDDGVAAAVDDGHDLSVGQPACEQDQQLPRTVS